MRRTLLAALKALNVVRTGDVIRKEDGEAVRDAQTAHATYRICRKAGLPERGWHVLRTRSGPTRRGSAEPVAVHWSGAPQADR